LAAARPHTAKGSAIELPLYQEKGVWYGDFTVGASKNVKLAIQTGADVVTLNEGVYQPGPGSTPVRPFRQGQIGSSNYWKGTIVEDRVSIGGDALLVADQSILDITSSKPADHPLSSGDGMMGFWRESAWNHTANWFNNLCDEGRLAECRFGLAQGLAGKGAQYFGGVQESAFEGSLVTVPVWPIKKRAWGSRGDVVAKGKVISTDEVLYFVSNTNFNAGPIDDVQALFDAAGVESVSQKQDDQTVLSGYYPCDQPPSLGIQFPSASDAAAAKQDKSSPVSTESSVFNFAASSMELSRDGNNCTLALKGYSGLPEWTMGQILFNGQYVDHNLEGSTMGFAVLK